MKRIKKDKALSEFLNSQEGAQYRNAEDWDVQAEHSFWSFLDRKGYSVRGRDGKRIQDHEASHSADYTRSIWQDLTGRSGGSRGASRRSSGTYAEDEDFSRRGGGYHVLGHFGLPSLGGSRSGGGRRSGRGGCDGDGYGGGSYGGRRSIPGPLLVALAVLGLCLLIYLLLGAAIYDYLMGGAFFGIVVLILCGCITVGVLRSKKMGWPIGVKLVVLAVIWLVAVNQVPRYFSGADAPASLSGSAQQQDEGPMEIPDISEADTGLGQQLQNLFTESYDLKAYDLGQSVFAGNFSGDEPDGLCIRFPNDPPMGLQYYTVGFFDGTDLSGFGLMETDTFILLGDFDPSAQGVCAYYDKEYDTFCVGNFKEGMLTGTAYVQRDGQSLLMEDLVVGASFGDSYGMKPDTGTVLATWQDGGFYTDKGKEYSPKKLEVSAPGTVTLDGVTMTLAPDAMTYESDAVRMTYGPDGIQVSTYETDAEDTPGVRMLYDRNGYVETKFSKETDEGIEWLQQNVRFSEN